MLGIVLGIVFRLMGVSELSAFTIGPPPQIARRKERRKIELCNDLPYKPGEAHICLIISGLGLENDWSDWYIYIYNQEASYKDRDNDRDNDQD